MATISNDAQQGGEEEALRRALAEAEAGRETREREFAELRMLNRHLEQRAITAHRTLAYGLGKALIEARSVRGLLALPRRLRRLRLKQKAKRRTRVPDGAITGAALDLRFVDEALERLGHDGAESAATWVEALPEGDKSAKARAMADIAIAIATERSDLAASLGERAARLDAEEPRLLALVLALRDRGLVAAPAAIGEAIRARQLLTEPQAAMVTRMIEDARILAQGHPDARLREVRIVADRSGEIVIVHAAGDRLDHRVARIAALAEAAGLAWREIDMARFALDPTQPPPLLAHILVSELAATRAALTTARLVGAPALLDFGALPASVVDQSESELADVERARVAWSTGNANAVVARGDALGDALAAATRCTPTVVADRFGVAPGDAASAAAEFAIPDEAIAVACVAPLDDDPGMVRAFEAFAEIARADARLRLVVLGRGPAMSALAERAARLGLGERAQFVGLPLAMRWGDLFARTDLAMFPRERPLAPGSGLETALATALASGCRVIAGAEAWRWSAGGEAGPVLPRDDALWPDALAEALAAPVIVSVASGADSVIVDCYQSLAALPIA